MSHFEEYIQNFRKNYAAAYATMEKPFFSFIGSGSLAGGFHFIADLKNPAWETAYKDFTAMLKRVFDVHEEVMRNDDEEEDMFPLYIMKVQRTQ